MWTIILRTTLVVLVLGGGIASLIYGAAYHTAPVSEEQEIEVPIAPPPGFGPPGGLPFEGPPGEPSFDESPSTMEPPPFLSTVTETIVVTEDESEPTLIREVTFGGVTLLAAGQIMRTYSGQPPSLCPT